MIYNINKFSNLKFKFRLDEQKLYINRENPNQKKNRNYKFVSLDEVFDFITYFKRPVYKQVLDYFKKEGYL